MLLYIQRTTTFIMEKEILIKKFNEIEDPYIEKATLYEIMEELGIKFRKTNCKHCIIDYYNITKEQLFDGYDAAEHSDWDEREFDYIYTLKHPVRWTDHETGKSHIIKQSTPRHIIEKFIENHKGYYIKQLKIK